MSETAVDGCDELLPDLIYDVEVIHARDSWKKWKEVAGTAGRERGKPSDPRDGNGARRGAGAQRRPKLTGAGCRPCRHRGIGSSAPAPHARSACAAPLRAIRFGTAPPSDSGAGTAAWSRSEERRVGTEGVSTCRNRE